MFTCTYDTDFFAVDDFAVLNHPIHASTVSTVKRLIDIFRAIIGLMITAVVAIPVACANLIDNPGPIFYSQIRCGLNGKPFRMWKFRSMIVGADKLKHLVTNEAIMSHF